MKFIPLKGYKKCSSARIKSSWMKGFILEPPMDDLAISQNRARYHRDCCKQKQRKIISTPDK